MKISYKAGYHLLDSYFAKRSLNQIIENYGEELHQFSLWFAANHAEYFDYLDVIISKRALLDDQFVLFTHLGDEFPYVLEKDKDLTILEFGLLCYKIKPIDDSLFRSVVVSQVEGKAEYGTGDAGKQVIGSFDLVLAAIENIHKKKG